MERTKEGLKELYQDLLDDCKSFDNNQERKAKDIAGRIRTLLKDGPSKYTISILKQLDKKNIQFIDSSAPYNISPGLSFIDFINCQISNSVISISGVYMGLIYKIATGKNETLQFSCAPLFRRNQKPELRRTTFDNWWNQVIYEDPYSKLKLTRESLILSSSEKDGFAHFDKELNDEYKKLLESDVMELLINENKIRFTNNAAKNSIRQIGYEVLITLEENIEYLLE